MSEDDRLSIGAERKKKTIVAGGAQNYMFWAADLPNKDDTRDIVVTERGHRIFKRRFCDLGGWPS